MHRVESDAIAKLFTPLFIKFKACMQKCLFISMWESPVSGDQIFVNIQKGFALIFPLGPGNKDIFAEDFLHKA